MSSWLSDIRYGARKLLKSPGFTVTATLTLALGISVITAMFNLVNGLLLRPYPYPRPAQLVVLKTARPARHVAESDLSFMEFSEIGRRSRALSDLGIVQTDNFNVGSGDSAFWVKGGRASASLFHTLAGTPLLGRTFLPDEDRPGGPAAVLLGEGLWRRSFGGDRQILGKRLMIDGVPRTVVGVVPASDQFPDPEEAELFVPIGLQPDPGNSELFGHRVYLAIGRLRPGFTAAAATADLRAIDGDLATQYHSHEDGVTTSATELRDYRSRALRGMVLRLFMVAAIVLLVACFNVATLLIQRGAARQRELALRMSLGADQPNVIRLLLSENLILALLASCLGTIMGYGIFSLAMRAVPVGTVDRALTSFSFDGRLALFLICTSVATALVFGLAPAWILTRGDIARTLQKTGAKSSGGVGQRRLRAALIAAEVALSIVSLTAAGLMVRSLSELERVDPGFVARHVLTMKVSPPRARYAERAQRATFYHRLLDQVAALPGVRAAAAGRERPLANWSQTILQLENQSSDEAKSNPNVFFQLVDGDYFRALGQKLVRGRVFEPRDTFEAPKVAVVNQKMADRFWPGEDAIGKRLRMNSITGGPQNLVTVVGVVADTLHAGLKSAPAPDVYLPYQQVGLGSLELLVSTTGDPERLIQPIRRELRAIDPDVPSDDTSTMTEAIAESLWADRTAVLLLGVFGGLALLMAAIGLYGAIASTVARRTNEIGIRMALGARHADVLRLIFTEAGVLVGSGLAAGLLASLAAAQALSSLLFKVQMFDAVTYLAVTTLICLVALAASGLPARRAMRVPPTMALREE